MWFITGIIGCLGMNSVMADSHTYDVTLNWDANSESDLAGYKVYYGTLSRGCDDDPVEETFFYNGTQALEANSPIVLRLEDLDDPAMPSYKLHHFPTGTPSYFSVTAFNSLGLESNYSGEATKTDESGPHLCAAIANTGTTIQINYSEFVDPTSATSIINYALEDSGGSPVTINSISYDYVTFKDVSLNTVALVEGETYTLTISNVTDYFGGNPITVNNSKTFTYTNAPHITRVTTLNHETSGHFVEVEFSEDVSAATAEALGNYSLDNGVTISQAQLAVNRNDGTDLRRVHLRTSTLTEGTTYQLTVSNVTDTTGNPITPASVFSFDKPTDTITPQAFSGHVSNPALNDSKVYVVFSEDMDGNSAGDMANYNINNGIVISGASFGGDGKTVTLTTSPHAGGHYQITVGSVQDDSVAANSTTMTVLDYWVSPDTDGDGILDSKDNCSLVANPNQLDADADDYGNACDADYNNDGVSNSLDVGLFRNAFGTNDPIVDHNEDGAVNSLDIGVFRNIFGTDPGPSGPLP
jgi:hypothetical protein